MKEILKSAAGKGGGLLKAAGGKLAGKGGGLLKAAGGKLAGGAGAAGSAAKGLVIGGTLEAGKQGAKAVGDPSVLFTIFGFVLFFKNLVFSQSSIVNGITLADIISIIFLWYAAIVLFENRGLYLTAGFTIWFIVLGAPNPIDNMMTIVLIVITAMLVHGLVTKVTKKGTFGDGLRGEVTVGLIPILFFLLDVGAVEYLGILLNIPLNNEIMNIVLVIPWWGYLGLFYMKTTNGDGSKNMFKSVLKFIGIAVLVLMLLPIIAESASDSKDSPFRLENFRDAQANFGADCEKARSWHTFTCMGDLLSGKPNIEDCVNRKLKECEFKAACNAEGLSPGTTTYNRCVADLHEQDKNPSLKVAGTHDPTINEPTKITFKIDKESLPTVEEPLLPYTSELEIKNPRKLDLDIEVSCKFVKKRGLKKEIAGTIVGLSKVKTEKKNPFKASFSCKQDGSLEGSHDLIFTAVAKGMETESRLIRAVVGDKEPEEIEILKPEINTVIPTAVSMGPADPARIDFDLGHSRGDRVIEDNPFRQVHLRSKIANVGSGKVTKATFKIDLPEGFTMQEDTGCLSSDDVKLTSASVYGAKQEIPLPTCTFTDMPDEWKPVGIDEWFVQEVRAVVNYDYAVEAKQGNIDFEKKKEPECNDNKDNDGDGLTDLADPGCENAQDNDEKNIIPAGIPQT